MTLFERHIIRRVVTGFAALLAILIAFFIVLHYVEYIDDFYDRGATMRDVFLVYYPSYIPEIVRLISPLAVFLASIHLTAKLTESLQLNALWRFSLSADAAVRSGGSRPRRLHVLVQRVDRSPHEQDGT